MEIGEAGSQGIVVLSVKDGVNLKVNASFESSISKTGSFIWDNSFGIQTNLGEGTGVSTKMDFPLSSFD